MHLQVVEKQGWAQEQERGEADLAAARGEIQELQQQVADCGVAAEEQASLLVSQKEETESLRCGSVETEPSLDHGNSVFGLNAREANCMLTVCVHGHRSSSRGASGDCAETEGV